MVGSEMAMSSGGVGIKARLGFYELSGTRDQEQPFHSG